VVCLFPSYCEHKLLEGAINDIREWAASSPTIHNTCEKAGRETDLGGKGLRLESAQLHIAPGVDDEAGRLV
jgi:hypothetical protein